MKNNNQEKFPGFPPEPITNFWSYPKIMDNYWHSLKSSEHKVLDYILRHTWGFAKTGDEISLSQLEGGIKNYDKGTGLSRPTIIKSLKGLTCKGYVKKSVGKVANRYELVKDFNYPSKESLPFASKKTLHTIDNITIDNKQYNLSSNKDKIDAYKKGKRWGEKPYFWGEELRWIEKDQVWRIFRDKEKWPEFVGKESDIEWK